MSSFRFKQFEIQQANSAMKVGTDGVLLGAWADCSSAERILDIGSGTGLIALMLAQRNWQAQIDAIEIDAEAYEQSLFNISNAAFADKVQVFNASLEEWIRFSNRNYHLIVCNPPYFEKGYRVADAKRKKARDAAHLPAQQIIDAFIQKTDSNGVLSLILPVQEAEKFIALGATQNIYPSRTTTVYSKPGKPAIRLLLEFVKQPCACKLDELIIEETQHQVYTTAYKELTKEFYLNF